MPAWSEWPARGPGQFRGARKCLRLESSATSNAVSPSGRMAGSQALADGPTVCPIQDRLGVKKSLGHRCPSSLCHVQRGRNTACRTPGKAFISLGEFGNRVFRMGKMSTQCRSDDMPIELQPKLCARFKSRSSNDSEALTPLALMFGWWQQSIGISSRWPQNVDSGWTCTIGRPGTSGWIQSVQESTSFSP